MSVIDRERLDRILNSYILELEKIAGSNFKYAEAKSRVIDEKWVKDEVTMIIVLHERQQDMAFLTRKITKLTEKYNKRTGVIIYPILQWADDGEREEVVIS